MSDHAHARLPRISGTEYAYEWFCRGMAVFCLILGLLYWVRLVGLYEGSLWRFDLMPLHWQVAGVVLSVLFPIAATGLWMAVSWGPVIWFIAAGVEIAMYAGFPDLFGNRPALAAMHMATILVFVAFRVVLFMEHRKREATR